MHRFLCGTKPDKNKRDRRFISNRWLVARRRRNNALRTQRLLQVDKNGDQVTIGNIFFLGLLTLLNVMLLIGLAYSLV